MATLYAKRMCLLFGGFGFAVGEASGVVFLAWL